MTPRAHEFNIFDLIFFRLDLDATEVKSVFVAASQLKIESVSKTCAKFLVANLNFNNAIEIRALPGINKDKTLLAKIDHYISSNVSSTYLRLLNLKFPPDNFISFYGCCFF